MNNAEKTQKNQERRREMLKLCDRIMDFFGWLSVIIMIGIGFFLLIGLSGIVWYGFLKPFTSAVPTWACVVVGVTTYFTLNHIYVAWLFYAEQHPNGLAAKIIYPWPLGEFRHSNNPIDLYAYGLVIFAVWWLSAIISYTAWLIFGGGIAKLLHLLPREPRP